MKEDIRVLFCLRRLIEPKRANVAATGEGSLRLGEAGLREVVMATLREREAGKDEEGKPLTSNCEGGREGWSRAGGGDGGLQGEL